MSQNCTFQERADQVPHRARPCNPSQPHFTPVLIVSRQCPYTKVKCTNPCLQSEEYYKQGHDCHFKLSWSDTLCWSNQRLLIICPASHSTTLSKLTEESHDHNLGHRRKKLQVYVKCALLSPYGPSTSWWSLGPVSCTRIIIASVISFHYLKTPNCGWNNLE